jgi:hypothetical protein
VVLAYPLRAGRIRQAAIEDFFHQRIAARNDIAYYIQVGLKRCLLGAVTLDQRDALLFQLGAHRRVDIGVAAGHLVAGLAGQHGEPPHESAADAKDMYMHCTISD